MNYYPIYCIPAYPANIKDYEDIDYSYFRGISDHTPNLELLSRWYHILKDQETAFMYFEKHMMLDTYQDCLEKDWSMTFSQLEEVLK